MCSQPTRCRPAENRHASEEVQRRAMKIRLQLLLVCRQPIGCRPAENRQSQGVVQSGWGVEKVLKKVFVQGLCNDCFWMPTVSRQPAQQVQICSSKVTKCWVKKKSAIYGQAAASAAGANKTRKEKK